MMRKILAFVAVGLLSLAFAGSAFATQSATEDAYGGAAGVQEFDEGDTSGSDEGLVAGESEPTTSGTSGSSDDSGSLPFTGLDIGLIALAGIVLVGTGLVVRRTTRSDPGAGA